MDFTQEFWHTATTAWACGVISVLCAFEAWRQKQFRWQLLGGILAGLTGVLCPATLTRGYYEMVQVNQQLATMVAAKRAEGVQNGRVVAVSRSDVVSSKGGCRFEFERYSDGSYRQVLSADRRTGGNNTAGRADNGTHGGPAGSLVSMPFDPRSERHF